MPPPIADMQVTENKNFRRIIKSNRLRTAEQAVEVGMFFAVRAHGSQTDRFSHYLFGFMYRSIRQQPRRLLPYDLR